MPISYDEKSFELAEYFLQDEPWADASDTDALAQLIQGTIEDFINYELPDDVEVYTHRSGRTGRAGNSGVCISLVGLSPAGFSCRVQIVAHAIQDHPRKPLGEGVSPGAVNLVRFHRLRYTLTYPNALHFSRLPIHPPH